MRNDWYSRSRRHHHKWTYKALAFAALSIPVFFSLHCQKVLPPLAELARVTDLFLSGELAESQQIAATSGRRYDSTNPSLAQRFHLVEAEAAAWRGLNEKVTEILNALPPLSAVDTPDVTIQRLSLKGTAQAHEHNFVESERTLAEAERLCTADKYQSCGELRRAQGSLATARGDYRRADRIYLASLSAARETQDRWDEAAALMNLGSTALREEKFDEAIAWSEAATRIANEIKAGDILLNTIGNEGWAYYKLGNLEKALNDYRDAEQRAVALGDTGDAVAWLTASGYIYEDQGDPELARSTFRQALELAKQINSREDVVDTLEDLAHAALRSGQVEEAQRYLRQLNPLIATSNNPLDALDVKLAQAKLDSLQGDLGNAERLLREVNEDAASQTSMRMGAEHELALLYEQREDVDAAEAMYRKALETFDGARDQLKEEDSKLPFLANATGIYDDYIQFLVRHGRPDDALKLADESRAKTLSQGLGLKASEGAQVSQPFTPQSLARKSDATLLFYWLGEKQSFLWTVTARKTGLTSLPDRKKITTLVERYNRDLSGASDALDASDGAGQELYAMLVAPAAQMIDAKAPVVVLTDGALSLMNFETLIAPPNPSKDKPHYWIEDATVISAPSLAMLAAGIRSEAPNRATGKLLLLGDAVSPEPEYPELPFAPLEMKEIQKHFAPNEAVVFARHQATSEAYLHSNPRQYSYIHFVSHGVASRTDPLDSAIILSRSDAGDTNSKPSSFKLYAREIMQHSIDARVVTISACNSGGTRAFAGEGLVGLSWAFLRAGAHSTVAALWEVNDNSTSRLMGTFYEGLEAGQTPASALRNAKLSLLHTKGNFRKPFYWAPFQLYTRM